MLITFYSVRVLLVFRQCLRTFVGRRTATNHFSFLPFTRKTLISQKHVLRTEHRTKHAHAIMPGNERAVRTGDVPTREHAENWPSATCGGVPAAVASPCRRRAVVTGRLENTRVKRWCACDALCDGCATGSTAGDGLVIKYSYRGRAAFFYHTGLSSFCQLCNITIHLTPRSVAPANCRKPSQEEFVH